MANIYVHLKLNIQMRAYYRYRKNILVQLAIRFDKKNKVFVVILVTLPLNRINA